MDTAAMASQEEIAAAYQSLAEDPGSIPSMRFENPGDSVIGLVQGFDKGSTDFGSCPIIHLFREDTQELVALWCFGQVLVKELHHIEPQIGDRIGVRFDGVVKGGTYNYKKWTCKNFSRKPAANRTFADVAGPAEEDPASQAPAPQAPPAAAPQPQAAVPAQPAQAAAPARPVAAAPAQPQSMTIGQVARQKAGVAPFTPAAAPPAGEPDPFADQ